MNHEKNIYQPEFIPYKPHIKEKYGLTTNETLCYGFIAFYAKNNKFYFSSKQFGNILDVTPRTIDNYISKLKKKGLIKTNTKRYNDGNGHIKSKRLIYLPKSSLSSHNDNTMSSHNYIKDNYNKRNKKEKNKKEKIPYKKIITHLNKITNRTFKYTTSTYRDKIRARWNEGYKLQDFIGVHKYLARERTGTKYEKYIRPSTIYRKSNFPKYVEEVKYKNHKKEKKKKKVVSKKKKKNKTKITDEEKVKAKRAIQQAKQKLKQKSSGNH